MYNGRTLVIKGSWQKALYYVIIGCVISGVMFVMASDMAANSEDKWAIAICILVGIIFLIQCLWYAISALRIVTLTKTAAKFGYVEFHGFMLGISFGSANGMSMETDILAFG